EEIAETVVKQREIRRWEVGGLKVALEKAQDQCSEKIHEVFDLKSKWLISRLRLEQADTTIESLQRQLQDYENEVLTVMDLKEKLYESQLRLSKVDNTIQSLHFEMKNLEDRWMSETKFLEGKLEKIRATMISYAIPEDISTTSSDKQVEGPSLIVVEDPISAIIVYEPLPMFEEEDMESVREFEMSSSEDVDSLFDN
ncbi:hypothetical protein Dimus_024892, partial [Dionaea muscipula]